MFVGPLLPSLPGLFLAVTLVFAHVVVAVEDAGVVESLERSWSLTAGNRVRPFVLGVVVAVAAGVVGGVFGFVGAFVPVVGDVLTAVGLGLTSLFSVAVLVGAYVRLAGGPARPVGGPGTVTF